ncbi:unnamed protein product [Acanthoscelides obtectus]|uniref:Uncharacterized protein n=1 Tax=Acanthoscelides obtectus TaxID=200917 RepID=A0A9P0L012_ACAOB|nr:unnamed protein product [Acanthoscelides obtectus]CAK1654580.1 hypothetical protein AOBTE_LOCUS18689 [Acanthoscelides obtectus]
MLRLDVHWKHIRTENRGIPWLQYIGAAEDNLILLRNVLSILSRSQVHTNKYSQRIAIAVRIQEFTRIYMISVTFIAAIIRFLCLKTEYEYNYTLTYIEEKFGRYAIIFGAAYLIIDSAQAAYTGYANVCFSYFVHGIVVQFVHIFETMESISEQYAPVVNQLYVYNCLRHVAKEHAEVVRQTNTTNYSAICLGTLGTRGIKNYTCLCS